MARSSNPKKLALWQGRFRRFLDSGLVVARFCAIEHVSESSFYYWQKKLGPQALRSSTTAEDRGVFRPVTVMPTTCGVLVRLPGGTQIEVGTEHLDAIRTVVAEIVRVDHGQAVDRNASSDNQVIRNASSGNPVTRKASSDNQVIRQRGGTVSC